MTDKYAVIGNPVEHSLSPRIHRLFASETGHALTYKGFYSERDSFVESINIMRSTGFLGVNVTIPFKEEACALADSCTDRVVEANVANVLSFRDGKILADNTDGVGLVKDLEENLGFSIASKDILIIGAGGAAQGVIGPILTAVPASVTIANRTTLKAEALARKYEDNHLPVRAVTIKELENHEFHLVINATSSSLHGESLDLPVGLLTRDSLAYDMMYGPSAQTFLNSAFIAGATRLKDGLGMLVEQAAESFFIWRGVRPQTRDVIKTFRQGK